jgi:uncharacterized membrane protein
MFTLIATAVVAAGTALPTPSAVATPPHYTLVQVRNSPTTIGMEAYAINDHGTIVGDATLPDFSGEAYAQGSDSRHFRGFKPFGGPFNRANAIASNGDIAGAASNPGAGLEGERAFLVINGQLISPFPDTAGSMGMANGINAKGAATGGHSYSGGSRLGWIYDNGQLTDIPTFGGSASVGNAINAHGTVVGLAQEVGDGVWTPFIHRDGVMKRLPIPANRKLCAVYALNNADAAVGACTYQGRFKDITYAEYWHDGVMTELPGLVESYSLANAINDAGVIVGWSSPVKSGFGSSAVVWIDGAVWDLNQITTKPAGLVLSIAVSVTSDGRILAGGNGPDGVGRNFVLTPDAVAR